MVEFEKLHCMLLTGEANYTNGIRDRGMKASIEYCIKQQDVLRKCLDVLGCDDPLRDDYLTYTHALLTYYDRMNAI